MVAAVLAGGGYAYYRYSVGVIGPDDIYPDVLGLTLPEIEQHVGKPRRVDELFTGSKYVMWQGREPYWWTYTIWIARDVAVHVSMPNDLVGLELDDVVERVGPGMNWQVDDISYHDQPLEAYTNEDRSIAIFDTGESYNVSSSDSGFWE